MVNMVIKLNKSKTETQQQTNHQISHRNTLFHLRCEMSADNLNTKGKQYLPFIKVF